LFYFLILKTISYILKSTIKTNDTKQFATKNRVAKLVIAKSIVAKLIVAKYIARNSFAIIA